MAATVSFAVTLPWKPPTDHTKSAFKSVESEFLLSVDLKAEVRASPWFFERVKSESKINILLGRLGFSLTRS